MQTFSSPLEEIREDVSARGGERPRSQGVGGKLFVTYFEVSFSFPETEFIHAEPMSDNDLIVAATEAGTFRFLDSPEEDIYNDLIQKRPPHE